MAYMSQERKAALAVELKKVVPTGWKYSLSVWQHTHIVLTVTAGPAGLLSDSLDAGAAVGRFHVNTHDVARTFKPGAIRDTVAAIVSALNTGNHDRSDPQADYFDVGWFVSIVIGRVGKPFRVVGAAA